MKSSVVFRIRSLVSFFVLASGFSGCSRDPVEQSGLVTPDATQSSKPVLSDDVDPKVGLEAERAATQRSKPTISDDARSRIIGLLEKAARLRASTEQGIAYEAFKDQLAEVKSAWETSNLVGWPDAWKAEHELIDVSIQAWSFALELWEIRVKIERLRLGGIDSNMPVNVSRQKEFSKMASTVTGDKSVSDRLDKLIGPPQDDGQQYIRSKDATEWYFLVASLALDRSRDGLRTKLKQ